MDTLLKIEEKLRRLGQCSQSMLIADAYNHAADIVKGHYYVCQAEAFEKNLLENSMNNKKAGLD